LWNDLGLVRRIWSNPDDVPAAVSCSIDVADAVSRERSWLGEREAAIAISEYFLGTKREAEGIVRI
jgi:hypothetical protein